MQFRRFGNKYFVRNRRGFLMKEGRKGFTLIELLIVIVVIGILSAMMMLSANEAADSAKASNVISNMRQIKTAAIAWYLDNLDKIETQSGKNQYAIKIGSSYQDIQTYFSGYQDRNGKEITAGDRKAGFWGYFSGGSTISKINASNMTGGFCTKDPGDYGLINSKNINSVKNMPDTNKNWYTSYRVGKNDSDNVSLQKKLAGRAKTAGLIGENGKTYSGGKIVFMHVLKLGD